MGTCPDNFSGGAYRSGSNSLPDVDGNLAPHPVISVRLRGGYLNDREGESSIDPELASWYLPSDDPRRWHFQIINHCNPCRYLSLYRCPGEMSAP